MLRKDFVYFVFIQAHPLRRLGIHRFQVPAQIATNPKLVALRYFLGGDNALPLFLLDNRRDGGLYLGFEMFWHVALWVEMAKTTELGSLWTPGHSSILSSLTSHRSRVGLLFNNVLQGLSASSHPLAS